MNKNGIGSLISVVSAYHLWKIADTNNRHQATIKQPSLPVDNLQELILSLSNVLSSGILNTNIEHVSANELHYDNIRKFFRYSNNYAVQFIVA